MVLNDSRWRLGLPFGETGRARALPKPRRLSKGTTVGRPLWSSARLETVAMLCPHPNETRSAAPGTRAWKSEGVSRRRLQRMVGPRRLKYPTAEPRKQAAMGFR